MVPKNVHLTFFNYYGLENFRIASTITTSSFIKLIALGSSTSELEFKYDIIVFRSRLKKTFLNKKKTKQIR